MQSSVAIHKAPETPSKREREQNIFTSPPIEKNETRTRTQRERGGVHGCVQAASPEMHLKEGNVKTEKDAANQ